MLFEHGRKGLSEHGVVLDQQSPLHRCAPTIGTRFGASGDATSRIAPLS
jgi:hypothetical protein